ncbi:tyrosine-type recombinase/integrase [Embleya sp. NPDC005575]|uniref:tyrosine-type recombinase/integrase n=1 Tax=Embleya sp. NPDC005575 TaxID=3156892 RepID=UPI0033BDBA14
MSALAVVRDLREHWTPASDEELERFETDVLSGFVLARASAGLADGTIRGDVGHLDQIRTWFGQPLWDMEPADADAYFGKVLRGSRSGTRPARSQALTTYFMFLELRHKVELHRMTGRVVECPIDEMNRPRGAKDAQLRIPPSEPEVGTLFTGWGGELATCRKFAPTARNYTASKLLSQVGLRVSEACGLDLDDIKWDLGRFGKLHVRHGKGTRGSGPRERKNADGSSRRVGNDALRSGLKDAAKAHLPGWGEKLTPHVLRHFCASQRYGNGLDLLAIQEVLGHSWIATTMRYIHVQQTRVEDAWVAGMERAAKRLEGLIR